VIRRLAAAAAAAAVMAVSLGSTGAVAQEGIDGGEWAGSRTTRPAPVTSDPGSTIVEGRFQRDRPYPQPEVSVTVTAPGGLDASCPHLEPRTIPASTAPENGADLAPASYRFSAGIPFGPNVCNGTYGVRIVANVFGDADPVLTTEVDVGVAPAPVLDVRAERAGPREVEVSWARPATMAPDFLGFAVFRTSSDGEVTGFDIDDREATLFTDIDPPAQGGPTTYQVVARRAAPAAFGGEVTSSGGEALTPVEVEPASEDDPDAGDGPTTTGGSSTGSGPGGTSGRPSTVRIRPPAVGTSSGRFPPLRVTGPPTTLDTGFEQTLPFDEREEGGDDPVLPDDELASLLYEDEAGRGLAIPVATALVLAVWAFHLRYLARVSRPSS
jgi:hypothetical protein